MRDENDPFVQLRLSWSDGSKTNNGNHLLSKLRIHCNALRLQQSRTHCLKQLFLVIAEHWATFIEWTSLSCFFLLHLLFQITSVGWLQIERCSSFFICLSMCASSLLLLMYFTLSEGWPISQTGFLFALPLSSAINSTFLEWITLDRPTAHILETKSELEKDLTHTPGPVQGKLQISGKV